MQDSAVETVARVLQSFRTPQIESALSSLSIEQADILTKFVYRAFEIVGEGAVCQCLLLWHAQVRLCDTVCCTPPIPRI